MAFFDIVIVGSGFGGAVMAARLGAFVQQMGRGRRVLVLDKGNDNSGRLDPESAGGPVHAQGNRFRHTLAPNYLAEIAEVFTDTAGEFVPGTPSMKVIAGKGLGGGSLLYDGVSLRAPAEVFDQIRDDRRLWPAIYTRERLQPYYEQVERTLKVQRMQWTDAEVPHWQLATKRDFVFAEGCRRIGATAVPLKIADDRDANEGWWNQGQRFEGRQDLTKNYLGLAAEAGVTFWTGRDVEEIVPDGSGYVVRGRDRRFGQRVRFEIECTMLVVAAGCVATTGLLLRSRPHFTGARTLDLGAEANRPVLGHNLSANGDYGVTGLVGPKYEYDVDGHKGKPMSSFSPSFWREHKFILIPFYASPLYLSLNQISSVLPAADPRATGRRSTEAARGPDGRSVPDWGLGYKDRLRLFGSRMLTMGCLCLDACEGEVRLRARPGSEDDEAIEVCWPDTHPQTETRWNAASEAMRRIYEALDGEMFLDSYRWDGSVSSSHPLGGSRMADRGEETFGIVDPFGESFRNRNLFVVDGAIVPSALGVNPSLTIAAVAEFIADRLIRGDGTEALQSRLTGG